MANIKSSQKRARWSEARRKHNASLRSRMRTFVKKVLYALNAKDVEAAKTAYTQAVPILDSMVNKGIIHRNKAARTKSRLNDKIKALAA